MSDQPGSAQFTNEPPRNVPDYLYLAIIATIPCCGCLPLGIVAIISSMNVKKHVAAGQYDLAEKASKSAKMWSLISIGIHIVLVGISLALNVVAGILSSR